MSTPITVGLPEMLTVRDLMKLLRRSEPSIYRDLARGLLPQPLRIGGRARRWPRALIENWLAAGAPSAAEFQTRQRVQAV